MAGRAGHKDRTYARWWIWLAVAFAVAVGITFLLPFLSSPQPEQELQTAPTSITQADSTNNQSDQSGPEQQQSPSESEEEGDAIVRPQ
jgi:hypothetical protein